MVLAREHLAKEGCGARKGRPGNTNRVISTVSIARGANLGAGASGTSVIRLPHLVRQILRILVGHLGRGVDLQRVHQRARLGVDVIHRINVDTGHGDGQDGHSEQHKHEGFHRV